MHRNTTRTTTDTTRTLRWKQDNGSEVEHRKDKGDGCRQHPNAREQCMQPWIIAGWATHAEHRDIFKSNPAIHMLSSAWRESCTTHVCCQLWHMVQRPGPWPNKHKTKMRPHKPKWKEVCSISHTRIEKPTSGSGRGQKSHTYTTRHAQQYEANR